MGIVASNLPLTVVLRLPHSVGDGHDGSPSSTLQPEF